MLKKKKKQIFWTAELQKCLEEQKDSSETLHFVLGGAPATANRESAITTQPPLRSEPSKESLLGLKKVKSCFETSDHVC